MRKERLERMASEAGFNLKKCKITESGYYYGKWAIENASEQGPLYFEELKDVETWLVGKGATFKDGRKKKRGKSVSKYIRFDPDRMKMVQGYGLSEGKNFSESVRDLVELGFEAWQ